MSQQSSQNKQQCPNYNKHFPWSFLLNYGPALQDMSDENILSRLKDFNCEWLSRPNIAILQMAQTIKENWHLIHKMRGKVLTRNFVDRRRLANRQSSYQQPTRTSSKCFQDSHSSSTGQLSLGSCSNNSGRSRTSLNLFDNQDMDEQDKDEPDDRPGTSYN